MNMKFQQISHFALILILLTTNLSLHRSVEAFQGRNRNSERGPGPLGNQRRGQGQPQQGISNQRQGHQPGQNRGQGQPLSGLNRAPGQSQLGPNRGPGQHQPSPNRGPGQPQSGPNRGRGQPQSGSNRAPGPPQPGSNRAPGQPQSGSNRKAPQQPGGNTGPNSNQLGVNNPQRQPERQIGTGPGRGLPSHQQHQQRKGPERFSRPNAAPVPNGNPNNRGRGPLGGGNPNRLQFPPPGRNPARMPEQGPGRRPPNSNQNGPKSKLWEPAPEIEVLNNPQALVSPDDSENSGQPSVGSDMESSNPDGNDNVESITFEPETIEQMQQLFDSPEAQEMFGNLDPQRQSAQLDYEDNYDDDDEEGDGNYFGTGSKCASSIPMAIIILQGILLLLQF